MQIIPEPTIKSAGKKPNYKHPQWIPDITAKVRMEIIILAE